MVFNLPFVVDELTARERQVAELVARGYTNRQIAAALLITLETTKSHVSNILSKLRLKSRREVGAALDRLRTETSQVREGQVG